MTERQRDRDRQTDRQAGRQAYRQIDRQADRQTGRHRGMGRLYRQHILPKSVHKNKGSWSVMASSWLQLGFAGIRLNSLLYTRPIAAWRKLNRGSSGLTGFVFVASHKTPIKAKQLYAYSQDIIHTESCVTSDAKGDPF